MNTNDNKEKTDALEKQTDDVFQVLTHVAGLAARKGMYNSETLKEVAEGIVERLVNNG